MQRVGPTGRNCHVGWNLPAKIGSARVPRLHCGMHGMIFSELSRYANARLGENGWTEVRDAAGLSGTIYLVNQSYTDADMMALVGAAVKITKLPAAAVLEDFGKFIVPGLVGLYGRLIKPEWRTLELIENTEATIHTVVRRQNSSATPPHLKVSRTGPQELALDYSSARKLCHLARGIMLGVAEHYGDKIILRESRCMHRGADKCRIYITNA